MKAASMASMIAGSVTGVPTVAVPRAIVDPALVGRRGVSPVERCIVVRDAMTDQSTYPRLHPITSASGEVVHA